MREPRVVVTAVGGNIGQGIVKALRAAKRQYRIVGIDAEALSAGFSLVDSYYQVPRADAPGFKDRLVAILDAERAVAVYVCSPTELPPMSRLKPELEAECDVTVLVNPPRVIDIAEDKLQTANFLRCAGFPALDTALAEDKQEVARLVNRHGFPVILKPRKGFSSRHVYLVTSLAEIEAAQVLFPDMIVQQYAAAGGQGGYTFATLSGRDEYTASTLSGPDGKIRATIVLRRDLVQGTTYRTELVQDTGLTRQVEAVVEALGAIGPCNVQFQVQDGRALVFEINPRFSGTAGIRYLYGFNDVDMAFDLFCEGREVTQPALRPGVVMRYWNELFVPGASFDSLRAGEHDHAGIQTVVHKATGAPSSPEREHHATERVQYLDSMADRYQTEKAIGPDRKQFEFVMDTVLASVKGPKVLELGYGSGHWTRRMVDSGLDVTVVEGSAVLAERCRTELSSAVSVVHSLFEEFRPEDRYDSIIASCVLEHVAEPELFLSLLKSWLTSQGRLHVIVPNAMSLHRRVGLAMGMLNDPLELSPQELEVGHKQAYTRDILRGQLAVAGLETQFVKGIFVKPLSSGQMQDWPEAIFEGYNALSDELPEYTAFLYANCSRG